MTKGRGGGERKKCDGKREEEKKIYGGNEAAKIREKIKET